MYGFSKQNLYSMINKPSHVAYDLKWQEQVLAAAQAFLLSLVQPWLLFRGRLINFRRIVRR